MREIEIKAKVKDINALFTAISQEGITLPSSIYQYDFIFVLKPYKLSDIKKGTSPILRIREENGKSILNLKKDITDQLDCIEHETEIKDAHETEAILNELGYHKVIEVRKVRKKFKFKDYKVCIDEVENLGAFIELELIVEGEADVEIIRAEMWNTLMKFNISQDDKVSKGYDRLIDELK